MILSDIYSKKAIRTSSKHIIEVQFINKILCRKALNVTLKDKLRIFQSLSCAYKIDFQPRLSKLEIFYLIPITRLSRAASTTSVVIMVKLFILRMRSI